MVACIILVAYAAVALDLSGWAILLLFLLMTVGGVYTFSEGPRSLGRAAKIVVDSLANLFRNVALLGTGLLAVVALLAIPLVLLYLFIRFVKLAWVG
jgi:hypothetical protein